MKLPLAYTLRNRYASTEQDARLLNGYAEVIRNKKDRRKIDKSRAIKRPGITAAFENLAGTGQALYTPFTPDNSGVPATVIADTLIRGMSSVASKLAFGVQPSNADLNTSFSPAVTVRIIDVFGNLVNSSANVTVSAYNNNTGATLGGTLTQGAAAGTATFNNLTLNRSGDFTLLAVSNALRDSISASFSINTKLVFSSLHSFADAATPFNVTVQSQDSAGNVDTGYTGQITLDIYSGSGGSLFGTVTLDAVNGEATFSVSIDVAGSYTLIAKGQPAADGQSANPASGTSGTIAIGVYSLTSAQRNTGLAIDTGFIITVIGAISPTDLNGNPILSLVTHVDLPITGASIYTTTLAVIGAVPQNTFTSIQIGSKILTSATASFVTGAATNWIWSGLVGTDANFITTIGALSVKIN